VRILSTVALYALSFAVAAYALLAYSVLPLGAGVHPDMLPEFVMRPVALYAHAFAASVALLLGPWQFSARLRQKRPHLHRFAGRIYLAVGVLLGGLSGLYLAQSAYGGTTARLGFATLAVVWLFTGVAAFLAIRKGDVAVHRRWMTRNFALTFAAVMLRLYLPAAAVAGVDFAASYAVIAWLSWVPNLLMAEWLLRRGRRAADRAPA
jgi:uncharacterized membrane protein